MNPMTPAASLSHPVAPDSERLDTSRILADPTRMHSPRAPHTRPTDTAGGPGSLARDLCRRRPLASPVTAPPSRERRETMVAAIPMLPGMPASPAVCEVEQLALIG